MPQCLEYPERPCYGLEKARELEERLESINAKSTDTHREMYDRLRKLEIDQAETKTQYGHIMETLVSIKSDVAELKSKPGKRWESIVGALISALVGGLIAFALMQIGLG